MKYISTAVMWLGVSAAIIVTIIVTKRIVPLWFFIIPFIGHAISYMSNNEEKENENE